MKILRIPISKVKPAAYNPRKDLQPTDAQYVAIKRSLLEFGLVDPLVWNKRTGNLVGGHQRFKVLRDDAKFTHVDVSVVDLPIGKEKALNIALNKIAGEWDSEKLESVLQDLKPADLDLTGFNEGELSEIFGEDGKAGLTDDDDAPARRAKSRTKPGTLYQLGRHQLMCGDATKVDDVRRLMGEQSADMVFTDPPYNVNYEGETKARLKIQNDNLSPDEFAALLDGSFRSYATAVKKGASLYVCHSSSKQREFETALENAGFAVRTQIIWTKSNFAWGHGRYKFQHEPIFYAHVASQSDAWYGDRSQSTLWQENKPAANRLHPTMKPIELIERALLNSSKAGDLVADLFGGSGSTLIACERRGRKARLMEIDPRYAQVIVARWQGYSGKSAVLDGDGRTFEEVARARRGRAA